MYRAYLDPPIEGKLAAGLTVPLEDYEAAVASAAAARAAAAQFFQESGVAAGVTRGRE